ncbi:MAG: clostripain-related cysteine peptidase [Clostridia bacterium]|nr:clostripain-related cysteine peptidase [Clostridia bacterium]
MRRLFAALLLLTLMLMPHAMGAHEEKPITTTVMIYMCGSDLESRHGAATADIEEMLASKFNTDQINVVLLLGGSRQWQMGFDSDRVTVAEIGKRGLRTLALWNPMNMSDPNTLRNFIRYASERYPADRYGLILWDHGGGINGGVCHDELHPGDALTPNGIRSAVTNSGVGFEWIGFDACLMGNLETAVILQDCANYMIASEESEPACGWNYSFLYGLEKDADGAATGRRIINSFMKPARNSSDTFTLSCIDLSRIGRLEEYLDRYASHLSALLNMENFSEVAIARRDSLSFGRAIYDSRQDYDLVDLGSLLAHFTHLLPDEGAAVLNELSAAVVANRSNKADTTGRSV